MLFLKFSNTNISFNNKTFIWRFYIINKAFSIIKQVLLIDTTDLVIVVIDIDTINFIMHITICKQEKMTKDSIKNVQLKAQSKVQSKVQVKALLFDKALIIILAKYSNYNNVFLIKNAAKLLEYTGINDYVIKLEEDKYHFLVQFIV